jgi:hypothetical protein
MQRDLANFAVLPYVPHSHPFGRSVVTYLFAALVEDE